MVAMSIIVLTALLAVFAYVLAPDSTPYANRMIVELGAKAPGFSTQLLFVPKSIKQERSNTVKELFSGTPSDYQAVPMNGYAFAGNKLVAYHYIDDGLQDTLSYTFKEVLPQDKQSLSAAEQQSYISKLLISHKTFYLGTDRYGRDILSRLLVGSRVSISVGLVAVLLSITIGIILGSLAGYYGGVIDNMVMWVINILWSIPTLLLVFAITLTIGK